MFITENFLKNYYANNKSRIDESFGLESQNRLLEKMTISGFDVFISHSYLDKTLILSLKKMFEDCGYSVYIDWVDSPNLNRDKITEKTADFIRKIIKMCKSLAYISTDNVVDSRWCPWELGLADGLLKQRACVLPILKNNSVFTGQEYLGLYPYISYENSDHDKKEFWVNSINDKKKYISLRSWINGYELKVHN